MFSLPGESQERTDSCPPQQFAQVLINAALSGSADTSSKSTRQSIET